jgi:serine protease inhibitor
LVWDDEVAKIDFSFPSFRAKMEEPVDLTGVLSQPDGVPSLFGGKPFGPKVDGCVTQVFHFASFEADRKGAVAKAATVVVIGRGAHRPPLPFRCDRPFACILGTVHEDGRRFSPEFVLKVTGSCLRSDDPDGK